MEVSEQGNSNWSVLRDKRFVVHRSKAFQDYIQPDQLIEAIINLKESDELESDTNTGRGSVIELQLGNAAHAILRMYRRGGMARKVSSKRYFRGVGAPRPLQELIILQDLHTQGVAVSQPIASVVEKYFLGSFYEGAIATLKVEDSKNLLEMVLSKQAEQEILDCSYKAGVEARKMLQQGIFHPDLHLGNVLCDRNGNVVLIDFDRAREFNVAQQLMFYQARTIQRWERAAFKHGKRLGRLISSRFIEGLESE